MAENTSRASWWRRVWAALKGDATEPGTSYPPGHVPPRPLPGPVGLPFNHNPRPTYARPAPPPPPPAVDNSVRIVITNKPTDVDLAAIRKALLQAQRGDRRP